MLPVFPDFKKLELNDLQVIEEFTKQFPPYNDFEFMSLWTYNTIDNNSFSFLHENFVIKIQDFITGEFFFSFLGTNKTQETISALLLKSREDKLNPILRLIPEINFKYAVSLEQFFHIETDRDSFDYILSVDEIADFKGGKYYDKRNLINRFKRLYPTHSVEKLDLKNENTKENILELFAIWEKQKNKSKEETEIELVAIKKLFDLVSLLPIIGIGVFIESKLVGFATYHIVQDNYAIMSFEKGDISYEGIYSYLNYHTAVRLKEFGAKYINYEQDLGIPGLRKAKTLWRPSFFLKKYTISER